MRAPGILEAVPRGARLSDPLVPEPAARWLAALPSATAGSARQSSVASTRRRSSSTRRPSWTRWPDHRNNADALIALPKVRRLRLEGKVDEAHTLAELAMFGTPHRQASYQVLGDMTLLFGGHHEELASGYRRLARPRRRDRGGGVRARRNTFPARGLRERPGRRRRAPVRGLGHGSGGAAIDHYYRRYDAFERIEGHDHVVGGVVGARGSAFSSAHASSRRAGPSCGSATTSPFGERTRSRSSSPRRRTSATTTTSGRAAPRSTPRPRGHSRNSARATSRATARRCGASDFDSAASRTRLSRHSPRTCASNASRQGRSTLASSNCTSSSGATCCSAPAVPAPCRPTCRGSGTTATSPRGTASSRSTSTCR